MIDGGNQENRMRAGIENVPGIIGFAKAVELYTDEINEQTLTIRNHLWDRLVAEIPDIIITGPNSQDKAKRLCNHLSFVALYVEGESILLHLDMLGFMITTGSACANNLKGSHVLLAIGMPEEVSHGSIRLAISKFTIKNEINAFIDNLKTVITKLREISPINADFMKDWLERKARGEIDVEHDHEDEKQSIEE